VLFVTLIDEYSCRTWVYIPKKNGAGAAQEKKTPFVEVAAQG